MINETNPIIYLEFLQEKKLEDKVLPLRVKCYFKSIKDYDSKQFLMHNEEYKNILP